jgi:hypothetical protein
MFNSLILQEKGTRFAEDGTKIVDLFQRNFPNLIGTPFRFSLFEIDVESEFRPLQISMLNYNGNAYWDLILKFNGISNPFDIQIGDVLIIPDKDFLDNLLIEVQEDDEIEIDAEIIASLIDDKRLPEDSIKRTQRKRPTERVRGDDGVQITEQGIQIDISVDNESPRTDILQRALQRAQEQGNTVLSKRLAKLLQCEL